MRQAGAPRLSILALTLALTACRTDAGGSAGARAALLKTSRDWAQAAADGDVDRMVGFWADDAIVLPPDLPALVGKDAIRKFVEQNMAIPGFSVTWEAEQATISASGELGYLVEHNRFTFADATGTLHTQSGKAVTIWKKNAAGEWKCVIDAWNSGPAEPVLPRPR